MIDSTHLGRYELVDDKSNKYWHIILNKTTQEYVAQWGKITATSPQGTKVYTLKEAITKIREKIGKGYAKKMGYQETAGENSLHFIFEGDEAA